MTTERPRLVTNAEIERLEALLSDPAAADQVFSLDALQGLMAAAVSAPDIVPAATWLAAALADLPAGAHRSEIEHLARRLYEETAADLYEGMGIDPILPVAEADGEHADDAAEGEADWTDWCAGYLEGVVLWGGDWQDDRMTDEDLALPLRVIEAAAGESDDDPDAILAQFAASLDTRFADPADALQTAVQTVYDVNMERRKGTTVRRETPKVGRNDPCPCGSGKKYKQCHGKAA
jgi:uncharacterized protein